MDGLAGVAERVGAGSGRAAGDDEANGAGARDDRDVQADAALPPAATACTAPAYPRRGPRPAHP